MVGCGCEREVELVSYSTGDEESLGKMGDA